MGDVMANVSVERMRLDFQIEENKLNEKRIRLRQAELKDEHERLEESIVALIEARKELDNQLLAMPED